MLNKTLLGNASYTRGGADFIKAFADICNAHGSCDDCPIADRLGGLDCTTAQRTEPEKFVDAVAYAQGIPMNYYEMYCLKFPNTSLNCKDLAELMCRKAIFDGDLSCDGGNCEECWKEKYEG